MPEESDPAAAIKKGELKFAVEGERLHGGWVLVRIKNRRPGDKKNNWLLIKHRDEFARDNDGGALLAEDRSVASAARWPISPRARAAALCRSFSPPSIKRCPDAIRNSNKGSAAELRASGAASEEPAPKAARSKAVSSKRKPRGSDPMPGFIAPEPGAPFLSSATTSPS